MRDGTFTTDRLLALYDRVAEAEDAIPRLRRFVLDLAVRGKLVSQDANDFPVAELLKRSGEGLRLPLNWHRARLGEIVDFQYGKGLDKKLRLNEGPVPVFGSNGIVGFTASALTTQPSVIVGRKGSAGALNLCDGPSWTTDVAYFVEAPPFLSLRFLFSMLSSLRLERLGKGVKPGLSRSEAYELTVAIPPLAEQRRIVAKVDELMALCDRLEAARAGREAVRDRLTAATWARMTVPETDAETFPAHARFALQTLPTLTNRPDQIKTLRQTILNLAVRGKLVVQDPGDEPAAELLKRVSRCKADRAKSGIIPKKAEPVRDAAWNRGAIPEGWIRIALGQVTDLVTSGSRGWGEFYSSTGPGFVRAQNIRFGKLRLDNLACVNPPSKSEGSRTQVIRNDLLIVITGAGVTNPALLDQDLGEAYVSQHVGLVRPCDTELSSWLLHCLLTEAGGRAELLERAYGAGKPGLNLDNIRNLTIPLPPLAEQHRIVAKVDALMTLCDQLEASLTTATTTRSRLLSALLHEALEPGARAMEAAE